MLPLASSELVAVRQATLAVEPSVREYLSFRVGAEEYCIDILRVQEIRSYEAPTRLAGAPSTLSGVINLRGVIVPIFDLRLQMRAAAAATTDASMVVIVLSLDGQVIGTVVDSVSDVVELSPDQIKPAPKLRHSIGPDHLVGIAPIDSPLGGRMLIVLDIAAMMSSPDVGLAMAI
jgi:purine-binding chemotaxis protein CheW